MNGTDLIRTQLKKNPRKPIDIVLFTDGFCYLEYLLLTKKLVETRNTIVIVVKDDIERKK